MIGSLNALANYLMLVVEVAACGCGVGDWLLMAREGRGLVVGVLCWWLAASILLLLNVARVATTVWM